MSDIKQLFDLVLEGYDPDDVLEGFIGEVELVEDEETEEPSEDEE